MSVIGSILAKLELDITNFSSNLSRVQSDIEQTGKKLDGLNNFGNGLTSVGKSLTTSLTLPIVGVGAAATTLATNFEYSMSQVKAISGATGKEFKALEDEAIKLGGSTKFSAGEVADAMTEMAKAGWTTDQILAGMSGVLDAAAASGEGLGSVSTIVADAITGFGLQASDSAKVADLLTQAANSGTIGINDLGESFKYIAPVAGALGINIEDATTAIAAMSMAGIKGSQAGTSLRTMLANLVKPTDKMQDAMDELGISVTNQDGTMKSLDEIIANLRDSFSGLTDAEKAQYAATLAGKEGMSGMLSLLNLSKEEYDNISKSMYGSAGVAGETADIMQDNLKSAVEQLGGALESLAIRIGQQLIPVIRDVAEWITKFTEKLAGASDEQIQMGIKIAGVVAAAGPLLMVIGKMVTTFVKLQKAFTAVKSAIIAAKASFAAWSAATGVAIGPILAVVAVIAVLVAAFVNLWKNNEEFRNKVTNIWNGIKTMFTNFFSQITKRINSLGFKFNNFGEVLKAMWQGLCDFLAPLFIGAFEIISSKIKVILDVILGVVDFFIAVFKGDWEGAWNAVVDIFSSIFSGVVNILSSIGTALLEALDVVLGWFGISWEESWNGIVTFFTNIWTGIVIFFQNTLNGIVIFFTTIWTGISTFFTTIWTNIATMFTTAVTNIVTFVQTYFGGLFTSIQGIFNGIVTFFTGIWELIKNIFLGAILIVIDLVTGNFGKLKTDIANIWENIKTAFSTVWEGIKTIFTNVLSAISSYVTGVWNVMKTTANTVWNNIRTTISNVLNAIREIINNVWNGIVTFFTTTVTKIKTTVVNTFNNMKTSISTIIGDIRETIISGFEKAIEFITGLPEQAVTWGKDMIQGIIDGITGMIDDIEDTVSGVADSIRDFLGFSVPDRGPLHDYEEYMPHMIQGLTKNLKKAAPTLYKAAETVAGGLSDVFNNEQLQSAYAGAYGSVSGGTSPNQNVVSSTDGLRDASKGGTINIEKIEVRDDDDIEELTQGLYDHNDKSLRAMGRRNL